MASGRLGPGLSHLEGLGLAWGAAAGWGEVLGCAGFGNCGRVRVRPRSSKDRASAFGAEGWGFESLRGRQAKRWGAGLLSYFCSCGVLWFCVYGIAEAGSAGERRKTADKSNRAWKTRTEQTVVTWRDHRDRRIENE
jgi:hypothetical protein